MAWLGAVHSVGRQTSEDLESFLKVAVMPRTNLARSVAIRICIAALCACALSILLCACALQLAES